MSEAVMIVNTMRIEAGGTEGFEESIRNSLDFVEANGPQTMVEVFVDEESMRAYSFQFFRDSESIRSHWKMSDPYIRGVMEHATVERLDVYGQPDEEITDSIRAFSENGVAVTVTPRLAGFARFRPEKEETA